MADAARKITVSQSSHDEDELSLPPPPPVPPRPLDYEGASALSNLPVPPPKETFSTFYQQRQKSELKRIFKHIHPDLLASLDDTVDDEIIKAAQSETTDPDAAYQCEVQSMKWIFENWTLDNIGDPHATKKLLDEEELKGGDVRGTSSMFEHTDSTQQMAAKRQTSVRGDVRTSMWLFETQPLDSLNKSKTEEGELVEAVLKEPIQPGNVRGTRHLFESRPLSELGRYNSVEDCSFLKLRSELQEQKGDAQKTVKLFEAEPFCAIKDNSGNIHEIKSICREEINSSDFNTARWLFETQPLDLINKGQDGVKIIRGISLEEGHRGGVDQKRWMFETQSFDTIKEVEGVDKFEGMPAECREEANVVNKKKLFEMQPLAALKGDSEERSLEKEEIIGGDVKTSLWLFETQPMESLGDGYEIGCLKKITLSADKQEERGKKQQLFREQEIEKGDVKGFKHLFETIPLSKIAPSDEEIIEKKNTTAEGNFKELLESQSLNDIGSEMVTSCKRNQDEHIEKCSVHKFTWMFENCPHNLISKEKNDANTQIISGVESGDVQNKKFIFETCSLDKIHDEPLEQMSLSVEQPVSNVDVKSSTMMFESLPLYAIRDKEGVFHEVTTVKKDEVLSGDVRGARWMFETKPLDAIKAENEVYVIRAVTQEDIIKGDVKSARWRFETQPLDSFTSQDEPSVRVTEDFGSSNVQLGKQIFESEQPSTKFVRMVSVTDVQHGDVRTSTWLFENQTIDSLKGEPQEQCPIKTVHREDSQKGDVKRCTWLFESQPLDKIKEPEDTSKQGVEDEIPKVDVKCTTWLFETTPLDKITANNVDDTLSYLYQMSFLHSSGIIIEANESTNVSMAKYLLESNKGVQIHKEEVVEGNIQNIMLQLLFKPTLKPQVTLLREVEKGKVDTTVVELPVYQSTTTINLETDQRIQNIVQMIIELLVKGKDLKKGIVMQETAGGQAEMSVYSLICNETKAESNHIERGDVKSTIGNLIATANSQRTAAAYRVDENEKGNVHLYKSCIEKGDLQYLKSLHAETSGDEVDHSLLAKEQIEIVQGDVKEAKRSLCQQKEQVERTISDVLPGDVKNTKKVFSSECSVSVDSCIPKEEIVPGDVLAAKQQLAVKQPIMVEKEEIMAGDIKATMQSLERAKQQSTCVEREIIKPGTIYDIDMSAQGPDTEGSQAQKEIILSGDVKAAKRSLEMAKQQSLPVEREVTVPGKIYNLNVPTHEESPMQSTCSSSPRCQQVRTSPKVSDAVKDQQSHGSFEACQQSAVIVSNSAPESLPSFVNYECNGQSAKDETEEVTRGDVRAAIRSLQSTATEQKLLDKEDIVRGNVELALQSLEKSSVNVSKGDYKAAMIYRSSGRGKTVHKQCVVSMPPSDTKLSPSISVNCEGHPSITTQNPTPNLVTNGRSKSSISETPPPLPQKTSGKPLEQKPALPPKPQWMKSVVVEESSIPLCPVTDVACPVNGKCAVIPLKQRRQFPLPSTNKVQEITTHGKISKETLHETYHQNYVDGAVKDSNQTNKCLPKKMAPFTGSKSEHQEASNTTEVEMERNVIQKINADEEIKMCMKNYSEDGKHEMNISLQTALQNFERKESETLGRRALLLSKKVKVTNDTLGDHKQIHTTAAQQRNPNPELPKKQHKTETFETNNEVDTCYTQQKDLNEKQQMPQDKVVLREKKVKETEDERRQRLSVHKEEIMKGNVKAAMEIFENLRKRDELKEILTQVQEIEEEEETSSVDVKSLKTLYENVPAWIVTPSRNAKQGVTKEKKVEVEAHDSDLESISSVETAFEDLEKASKEIMNLKEQTLAKLLEIEETIKKALYSVSNLKSEADIAGLSGLFDESLKSEQILQPANNIKKISIVSSKAKSSQIKKTTDVNLHTGSGSPKNQASRQLHNKPLIRQSSSQSSPSFISIHSAARKPAEQPKSPMSTFKPKPEGSSQSGHDANRDLGHESTAESSKNSPSPAQRSVSVLEVKTIPEQPPGIIGTKTVSETYEETDGFGNVFVSSVMSTFVTKQSDNNSSTLFEVVGNPARYEVTTSPLMRRSGRFFEDKVLSNAKEEGTVFVTFSQPKEKH
uniref:xin actin-binding repeat-containing protein 1 n=1 Tax=Monopterus albus TaxID=43700 RepID=UPI0009B4E400|nr:xin actin-binding repeat-containing protein 1 [Monopterus albus]